ncbi:GGDEF domain-containing protein [Nakamurella antarctica]|uniref:GGDEF domain-containing protein n=1 Tax=Nakamurella antarctica TaxID=1902245 RepID=A0A3G8ZPK1_9ACTN|nr:GGDEF domain-containing protein [Nakamurella antarctica]AZI59190.1 GGDEF domain-containing protein [Nakamurella antarctica]
MQQPAVRVRSDREALVQRRLQSRKVIHIVMYAALAVGAVVSLLALPGADRLVALSWCAGPALLMAVTHPFLRAGRARVVSVVINSGLLIIFAGSALIAGTLPPAPYLPLYVMLLIGAFSESIRGQVLIYVGTVICVLMWMSAGLGGGLGASLSAIAYLTLVCALTIVGSRMLEMANAGPTDETTERAMLEVAIRENNEILEDAIVSRTSELEQVLEEKERLLRNLVRLTMADELTGLKNRRGFRDFLQSERQQGGPSLLAMMDLDGLKRINDNFGHLQGDAVLRGVARVLNLIGDPRVVPARISGDEFALVFIGVEMERAQEICWSVVEATMQIDVPQIQKSPITVTPGISVGLAHLDRRDIDRSFAHADDAMYDAKRAGGRRVVLHPELRQADRPAS